MDPVSIIGLLSAAGTLASTITITIKRLSDLRGQLQDADVRIRLLIGELSAVKSALNQINDWTHYLDDSHRQDDVVQGLQISLDGVQLAMDLLAEEVRLLMGNKTADARIANELRMRIKYAWNESSLTQHENRLRAQIAALQLLLQAVQCQSTIEEKEFLQAPNNRQIIQKVADDTSTLRASLSASASQGGALSIVSHDDSTIDSKIFDWDNEIVNADAYRRAMNHARSKGDLDVKIAVDREEKFDAGSQVGTEDSSDQISRASNPIAQQQQTPLPYETSIASEPPLSQNDKINVPNSSISDKVTSRRSLLAYRTKSSDTGKKSFWSNIAGKRSSRNMIASEVQKEDLSSGLKGMSGSRRGRRGFENSYHTSIDFGSEDGLSAPAVVRAAQAGSIVEVEMLLDQRADINAKHIQSGRSALAVAAHCGNEGVVRLLLQYGAAIDQRDASLLTPLHLASMRGHLDVISLLLQEHAEVDVKGPNDQTPLRLAAEKGEIEVAQVLLRKQAKANARDTKQMTPLHIAAKQGDEAMTELLVNNGAHVEAKDASFMGPLHYACEGGHIGVINILLSKKAEIEATGRTSMTPLLCASSVGKVNAVDLLLKKKANIKHKGEGEMTALHWAAFNGHVEVVDLLLQNKRAQFAVANRDGRSPLHLAILAEQFAVADLLLRQGAPIETQCNAMLRPIHYACMGATPDIAQLLLGYNANLEAGSNARLRPLHIACARGSLPHVELLLQKGVNIDVRNAKGDRPLCLASSMGHIDIVRALLNRGAALRSKFAAGPSHEDSPLCLAAKNGHAPVVLELLNRGASVLQKDERDWQPLRYAAFHAHPEVVDMLLKHGATVTGSASGGWGFNITAQRIGFANEVMKQEQRKGDVLRLLTATEAREQRAQEISGPSSIPFVPPAIQTQNIPMELPGPNTLTSPPLPAPRPPPQAQPPVSTQELPVNSPPSNYTHPPISSPSISTPQPAPFYQPPPQNYPSPTLAPPPQQNPNVIPSLSAQARPISMPSEQSYYLQDYPNHIPTLLPLLTKPQFPTPSHTPTPLPPPTIPQLSPPTTYTFVPKAMPQPTSPTAHSPNSFNPQTTNFPNYTPPAISQPGATMTLGPDGLWRQNANPANQRAPTHETNPTVAPVPYPAGVFEMAS